MILIFGTLHISGTIHHMIVIHGRHMKNGDVSGLFFPFFQNFDFPGCFGVKKIVENDKKICILCSMSQEPYIIWSSFVVHKCKMIISPQCFFFFFHFFKNVNFWVVRRVKCKKMAQNDKKFCFPCLVLQEPYIIWSSFMLRMCKRIISPGVFLHFFQILFLG